MTGKDLLEGLNFVDEDLIEEAGKETLLAETTKETRSAEAAEEKKKSTESAETDRQSKSGKRFGKHSGKYSGKVVFLRAAVSVAAGLLIFAAGTAVGSHKAVKPLRGVSSAYRADGETQEYTEIYTETYTEGIELLGAYPEEESQRALNEGEAEAMPQEGRAEAQSGEISVQEGMVGVQAENSDIDTLSLSADVKVGKKIAQMQGQAGHLPQLPATVIGGISVYFYQEDGAENSAEDIFFADFEQNNVSYTLQANTLREVVQAAADAICGTGVITVVD